LEFPASSEESRLDDLLDLPLGFAIDNVRCGAFVVRTVCFGLTVSGQEVDVEDWVDLHRRRESEAIGLQVTAFEPNLFVFLKLDWNEAFFRYTKRGFCFIPCFSDLSESSGDVRGLGLFIG
jgi:hypothetical protein